MAKSYNHNLCGSFLGKMDNIHPLHIAFNLLYIDDGNLTGPGYYAAQLLEHTVDIFRSSMSRKISAYVRPSARHHFSKKVQPYLVDVNLTGGRIRRVLAEQLYLPLRAKRDKVTLLFSPTFVSPLWGAPYLAVTVIDMYYRVTPDLIDQFQRRYWSIMIPASARACDLLLAISDSVAADIRHYLPSVHDKVVSIPLASRLAPPDPASREPTSQAGSPFLLMVANLTKNKNPQVVVRALAHLRDKGRLLRLVHAGKDHLGLLADAVEQYDAHDLVVSQGKVSDEALVILYRTCLAAVVPSLYEGFGMPAVEAQSQGAPLLSSDRGSLPEAGGDAALYFDPTDHLTLARHVELLLDHPDKRLEIITKGYRSASRFSWEKTAQRTLAALESVIEPRE